MRYAFGYAGGAGYGSRGCALGYAVAWQAGVSRHRPTRSRARWTGFVWRDLVWACGRRGGGQGGGGGNFPPPSDRRRMVSVKRTRFRHGYLQLRLHLGIVLTPLVGALDRQSLGLAICIPRHGVAGARVNRGVVGNVSSTPEHPACHPLSWRTPRDPPTGGNSVMGGVVASPADRRGAFTAGIVLSLAGWCFYMFWVPGFFHDKIY